VTGQKCHITAAAGTEDSAERSSIRTYVDQNGKIRLRRPGRMPHLGVGARSRPVSDLTHYQGGSSQSSTTCHTTSC
jgi:hypothetical protein